MLSEFNLNNEDPSLQQSLYHEVFDKGIRNVLSSLQLAAPILPVLKP